MLAILAALHCSCSCPLLEMQRWWLGLRFEVLAALHIIISGPKIAIINVRLYGRASCTAVVQYLCHAACMSEAHRVGTS